jgi:hypothetical protein
MNDQHISEPTQYDANRPERIDIIRELMPSIPSPQSHLEVISFDEHDMNDPMTLMTLMTSRVPQLAAKCLFKPPQIFLVFKFHTFLRAYFDFFRGSFIKPEGDLRNVVNLWRLRIFSAVKNILDRRLVKI